MDSAARFPKLIAFDLDYTLWDLWIDAHVTGPLHRDKETNRVVDRYQTPVELYTDVPEILHRIRGAGITIAACSRTHAPPLAHQALNLIQIPPPGQSDEAPKPAIEFFDQLEIYPGSKLVHFKQLHQKTGLPYSEMLFFDDERRNKEVEKLGVTFHLVSHGVNHVSFEQGLAEWRKRHVEEVLADVSA
ncbi:hypothetical protein APHAL10511_007501 [Amanita phalloides]|nr:hypothetical protein APHAL10511_007501 [Amanita phalloides]